MGEQKRRDAVELQMERNAVLQAVRDFRAYDEDNRKTLAETAAAGGPPIPVQPGGWQDFQTELVALIEKHANNLDEPLNCLGGSMVAFGLITGFAFGTLLADAKSASAFLHMNLNATMEGFGAAMADGRSRVAKGQPVN